MGGDEVMKTQSPLNRGAGTAAAGTDAEAAGRQTTLDVLREAERGANNPYREGFLAYADVVVATDAVSRAEQGAPALRLRRLNASVDLTKALGGGWRPPT